MVDTENNIIVVADYCQEEILSWTWTWTWTYLMVICRLYVCEPASSYGDLCRISRFSISYHMLVFWLRTRCLIRLSSGYVFPASFISTQTSRRECCVGKVMLPVCLRTWPVDSVPFHIFCLGGLGEGPRLLPSCLPTMDIPGPRLNVKTLFPRYWDSHVKDKTVARSSYL